MKKFTLFLTALLILGVLSGCGSGQVRDEVLTALEGSWRCEDAELAVSGSRMELTGYYEHDGQRLAGVVTVGEIHVEEDGTFTVDWDGAVSKCYLENPDTLIIDETEYHR